MDGVVTLPVLSGFMHEFKVKYMHGCTIRTFI